MDKDKIIYWTSTGLLCAVMLFSAAMYVFRHDMVAETYTALGYPTYLIYYSAAAKVGAVAVILSGKFTVLKEWAYAGLFFILVLANLAHIMAGDGQGLVAHAFIVVWAISYYYDRKR